MAYGSYPKTYDLNIMMAGPQHYSDSNWENIPPVENYVRRLIDDVHCEGALVSASMLAASRASSTSGGMQGGAMPQGQGSGQGGSMPGGIPGGGADAQGNMPGGPSGEGGMPGGAMPSGGGMAGGGKPGMPGQRQSNVSIKELVAQAKESENMGIDVISVSGNSLEQVDAIRNATNLILLARLSVGGGISDSNRAGSTKKWRWNYSGVEFDWQFSQKVPGVDNTYCPTVDEIEEAVEAAKKIEGMADILWIRDARSEHPNRWIQNRDKLFNLYYAEAIKKAGVKILVCPSAGFHNAAQNEEFIANGQCDMVGMATPFFADPEYVKKALEGRADDILPCLQCHSCHGISRSAGPWYDTCTVNPKWATPGYKIQNIPAPTMVKKVAVIGGGPGGMKAALVAAERGQKVTLYEKGESLGGLLQFSDYSEWRWNHKDLKDYLIYQIKKSGIDVKLNTAATPEMIKSKGYDTVLVATGAEPIISKMPGADGKNVFNILTAYSNKKALGKNVVMIGAGRIGTELAIGMAKDGHKVTQICAGENLIELEFIGARNMMNQILILQNHPDYDCILEATVKSITGGKVTYTNSSGNEKSIQADSIVIYSGLKPRMDEAEKLLGSANQVLLVGDCTGKNGTIQNTIRSAFFIASQV